MRNRKQSKTNKKTTDNKVVFRRSNEWKNFREKLKKRQKTDYITGSPLTKTSNCHHGVLDPAKYDDISDESKFIMLNTNSHSLLHFLYGDTNRRYDWKTRLKRLEELCIWMDELNNP